MPHFHGRHRKKMLASGLSFSGRRRAAWAFLACGFEVPCNVYPQTPRLRPKLCTLLKKVTVTRHLSGAHRGGFCLYLPDSALSDGNCARMKNATPTDPAVMIQNGSKLPNVCAILPPNMPPQTDPIPRNRFDCPKMRLAA